MNRRTGYRIVFLLLSAVFILAVTVTPPVHAAGESSEQATADSLKSATNPQEVDAVLARLSDAEIRDLVRTELSKTIVEKQAESVEKAGFYSRFRQWLHAIDSKGDDVEVGAVTLLGHLRYIPAEMFSILSKVGDGTFGRFLLNSFLILLAVGIGFGGEKLFRKITETTLLQMPQLDSGQDHGMNKMWAAIVAILPPIVYLVAFVFIAILGFLLTGLDYQPARAAFMALVGTIAIGRATTLVSQFLCAPSVPALRLFPLEEQVAAALHKGMRFFGWYLGGSLMVLALHKDLGGDPTTQHAFGALLGTVLLLLIGLKIHTNRKEVAASLLETEGDEEVSWARKQFASMWHVFAAMYLFGIWLIWINTILTDSGRDNGALIVSLLIVPIYLIMDRIGWWLIGNIVGTLGVRGTEEEEERKQELQGENYVQPEIREGKLKVIMTRVFRFFIVLVLFVWMMTLWGFDFPFAMNIVDATFDILITLTLALFIWRFVSNYIERKIAESTPEEDEEEEDDGGEFGTTRNLGRSYTLLPMIRKFIATTMMIMVSLIVLSSIGVDIGPLLAGAGVVGLAVGFGAQKLVSDVLSGVFYLLDDAFRVGEYIQAGSIKGAVEAITLRNVMLRHHRGMLQIVPHSDLGSITNYMRGGIVVKFNLEFPYDTDVDKVRKIIKKVGQAMLQDEELGEDFILPVKSQGVYEITNSVMVIRVKFTAHPGRQFLIRREAFRRITEALAAKGIHYAHRKVIVEVPQSSDQPLSKDQVQQAVEAGAAAGQITMDEKPKAPPSDGPF